MSKKHRIMIIVLVAWSVYAIIFASAYSKISHEFTYDDSGILVEYTSDPVWFPNGTDQSCGVKIIIYKDGTAEIINTPEDIRAGKEIPYVSFTIDASVVAEIQNEIISTKFIILDEDVSDPESMDGSYNRITVYTKKKSHLSGGLNPSNTRFCRVEDAIRDAVPEDVMKEYDAAVELYYSD